MPDVEHSSGCSATAEINVPEFERDTVTGLLDSMVDKMTIDYSTRCNLRCTYCHTGTPTHSDVDMTEEMLKKIHHYCQATETRNVWLSSSGETTMYADWQQKLAEFLDDARFELHINSNFARTFTDTDLLALNKLSDIQISIDSSSAELMKKQRTANLETVIANIVRLQQKGMETGHIPRLRFNCVVTRDNITHISDLARLALFLQVSLLMLTEVRDTPENPRMPDSLSKLSDEEAGRFGHSVLEAEALLAGSTTGLYIQPGFRAKLRPILDAIQSGRKVSAATFRSLEERQVNIGPCLMPWDTIMVFANGDVHRCCGPSVGSNGNIRERDLVEIIDGPEARAFRAQLLEGQPGLPCETCPLAQEVSAEGFRQQVRAHQERFAGRKGPLVAVES